MVIALLSFHLTRILQSLFQITRQLQSQKTKTTLYEIQPFNNCNSKSTRFSYCGFTIDFQGHGSRYFMSNKDGQNINYNSLVKFFHPQTSFMLHSHGVRFGAGGVFSVTGYVHDDHGSYFQINEKLNLKTKTFQDFLKCNDAVTIKSAIMDYFLRTQQTAIGLTSQLNQVVQGQTRQGVIDDRVNWRIICENKQVGQAIKYGDFVRIKHENTGKYASLSKSFVYNEANCGRGCIIAGQLQPHAIDEFDDDRSIFQIVPGMNFADTAKNIQKNEE